MSTTFAIESQQVQAGIMPAPIPEARPVIQLDHIHKVYTMGDVEVHALRGVSLTIGEGDPDSLPLTGSKGCATSAVCER